jgi:DUF3093 family protein
MKVCALHPLYDKLRDSVTSGDLHQGRPVMVDQNDHDLAPISGIDRARRVEHSDAQAGRQAGSRMHQADVPVGQFDGHASGDRDPGTGRDVDVGGGVQIGPGIARMGVRRERQIRVELADSDRELCVHGLVLPKCGAAVVRAYPRRVAQQTTSGIPAPTFSERLTVPWWWWPVAFAFAAVLAAEVFLGDTSQLLWLPYAILLPATAAGLIALGRIRVQVGGGELRVDDAHIPVGFLTEINILTGETKREVLGTLADPMAFVVQRPWVRDAVRVAVDDPADPTPYWIISTRRPAELARAIVAARAAAVSPR